MQEMKMKRLTAVALAVFAISLPAIADSMGNPLQNASDGDGGITWGAIMFGTAILVAVWYFFDRK
jgi:hypothetical protein